MNKRRDIKPVTSPFVDCFGQIGQAFAYSINWQVKHKTRQQSSFRPYENRIFKLFKDKATPYLSEVPDTNLEWLALAQHQGLQTRLLDWSYNPLVALFFAVESHHSSNCAVFAYGAPDKTLGSGEGIDPFNIKKDYKYRPRHFNERIRVQQSVFTLHAQPKEEFTKPERIFKIKIRNSLKPKFKKVLLRYHVNFSVLFPGLDGVAAHIRRNS